MSTDQQPGENPRDLPVWLDRTQIDSNNLARVNIVSISYARNRESIQKSPGARPLGIVSSVH
jgi:hypothetical protein